MKRQIKFLIKQWIWLLLYCTRIHLIQVNVEGIGKEVPSFVCAFSVVASTQSQIIANSSPSMDSLSSSQSFQRTMFRFENFQIVFNIIFVSWFKSDFSGSRESVKTKKKRSRIPILPGTSSTFLQSPHVSEAQSSTTTCKIRTVLIFCGQHDHQI